MTHKVVRLGVPLTDELAAPERKKLEGVDAELVMHNPSDEADLIATARDADAVISAGPGLTANAIRGLEKCRVIVRASVGYDMIDVDAATERGVMVANLPDYCIEEVADHALTLTLALARRLTYMERVVRQGHWSQRGARSTIERVGPVERLSSQTLGIVGFGNIGRLVARKASGVGWRILAADPFVDAATARGLGVELVPLDRLLAESDFVTLHVLLNAHTRHMIGAEQLAAMKRSAYLVNTCRGPVIDEPALVDALRTGQIAGAGLDVFEEEPIRPDNPLLQMDNVILTPHLAVYSRQALELNRTQPFDEVVRVLSGRYPRGLVNRSLKERLGLGDP